MLNIVTVTAKIHLFQKKKKLNFFVLLTEAIIFSNAIIAHRISVERVSMFSGEDTVSFTNFFDPYILQNHRTAHSWFLSCGVALNKKILVNYT